MLESSRRTVAAIPADELVVDIGGWADPLGRADWVIDVMPYESRGLYRRRGWIDRPSEPERFTADTWVARDLCDREPLPFEDGQVDFVVCAHTLEDLRDPLWVCSEMNRIARAGYVEVPSRLEEQSLGVEGPWTGHHHHRWLIEISATGIEFAVKDHRLPFDPSIHFPPGFWHRLAEEERVAALWWNGSFEYAERHFIEEDPMDSYLSGFVSRESAVRPQPNGARRAVTNLAARLQRRLAR